MVLDCVISSLAFEEREVANSLTDSGMRSTWPKGRHLGQVHLVQLLQVAQEVHVHAPTRLNVDDTGMQWPFVFCPFYAENACSSVSWKKKRNPRQQRGEAHRDFSIEDRTLPFPNLFTQLYLDGGRSRGALRRASPLRLSVCIDI